jgi:peroxiredoxin
MEKFLKYILLFALFIAASCKQKLPYGDALFKPEIILKDQRNFVNYWYAAMDLSSDYIALDSSLKQMAKGEFLKQIATGAYIPLRLNSDSSINYYSLYKINTPVDNYITIMLKAIGIDEYKNFEWEGKSLPEINYKDLEGKKYDSETIKGKMLVLDFWFIGCTACVAEMPELNKLKALFSNKKDILFAAIAFDKENALREFMKKTDFHYDIISDTAYYLIKKLGINSFPTSVIINKNGNIVKILDDQYHRLEGLKEILRKQ